MDNEEIGGKKDDKDKRRRKGKEKVEELDEEEKPRNNRYMEEEKNSGKRIRVPDDGDDLPLNWDWREYMGITSNVLEQGNELICWTIAIIRAIEALFNIGKRLEQQRSFSIQHLVNKVKVGVYGLQDSNTLGDFIGSNGLLEEGQCSYKHTKQTCAHENPEVETIDRLVTIDNVDDVELARLVWRHPVVGVVPLWWDLSRHRHGIYKPKASGNSSGRLHAVLIVGFGKDKNGYYWIVQNSWGRGWGGEEGFGRLHREYIRGRRSLFSQVYYVEKKGYPEKNK